MEGIIRGVSGFGFLAVMVLLCTTSPRVDWQEKGNKELGKEFKQARQLPLDPFPEVAPPTISGPATLTGAKALVVAETVATPIEQEVNGVEKMIYMASMCTNDGQMILNAGRTHQIAQVIAAHGLVVPWSPSPILPQAAVPLKVADLDAFALILDVTFKPGTDPNMAQVLVQNRVSVAETKRPEEVKRQGVATKEVAALRELTKWLGTWATELRSWWQGFSSPPRR
jgi:hypothetical protein